jgi:hypothetical protein
VASPRSKARRAQWIERLISATHHAVTAVSTMSRIHGSQVIIAYEDGKVGGTRESKAA